MGNLLCVPRLPDNVDRNKTKQKKRWFTRQSKKPTNTEIGPDSSTSTEPCKEEESIQREMSHEDKDENSMTKYVSQPNIHVDPVVSTSILLSHFDDESELTADHDGASDEEKDTGSSAGELISAENQQPEEVEESDEKGDVPKLVDNHSKDLETYTDKLGPTDTESTPKEAALIEEIDNTLDSSRDLEIYTDKLGPAGTESTSNEAELIEEIDNTLEPSKEMEMSDEVQTSLKGVDVPNRDLSGSTYFKILMAGTLSKTEEASKVEPVSLDIGISDAETTPDQSVNVAKPIDKASSVDIVKTVNIVDIATPEKPYDVESVSKVDCVPNRKEQSLYCFEKSKVETTKGDVHESLTETEIKNGRDVCPEDETPTEHAKETNIGKQFHAENVTKANSDETKTLEATDVNRVSKDEGRFQYVQPIFVVVKEDDNVMLDMKYDRSAALTCEDKIKLAENEINKTAYENKVDESKQSSTKCRATVCNKISPSADATAGIDWGQTKRETTEEIVTARLVNKTPKNDDRSSDKRTPCYNDVKALSDGKARKEIADKPVDNADVLADATTIENNKAKDRQLKAASSCPIIAKTYEPSNSMKELSKILEALSILKVPVRSEIQKSTKSSIEFSRNVISPHRDTSISSCVVNTKQSVLSTTAAISRTATSQNVLSSGSSVNNSRNTVMSTRAVSPQPGPSGGSHLSGKPLESWEASRNVTSTQIGPLTSSDVYVKPQTSTGLSGNVTLSQVGNPDISGSFKSSHGIPTWMKKCVSEPLPSVTVQESTSSGIAFNRKVSDFEIPKKKPRPPQKPLVLKKPSPHLFGLPGIAKSDLTDNNDVKWTQKNLTGPQTEVLWSSKPTSYDVKFPPLPKRLLEREGSIDKLRNSWVIPQVKQIETLKREFGRFPGLKVPDKRRNKYSVDINDPNTNTVKDETIGEENAEDKINLNYK